MFLEKNEINTGRQEEFDLLRGIFIPMILIIHAFQMMAGTANPGFRVFYLIATLTGTTLFMFIMGFGSTYSRRTEGQIAKDGLKMLLWQILWNLLVMALPFLIGQGVRLALGLPATDTVLFGTMFGVVCQYINVFFIAGISYLLLALMRKLKTPDLVYLVLGIVLLFAAPFLYMKGKTTGITVLDYILQMFAGGRSSVSLVFLPNFVYVLFGVWFGKIFRRTSNKKALYLWIFPFAMVILGGYVIYALATGGDLDSLYKTFGGQYAYPTSWRMAANLSCTLICALVLYLVSSKIPRIVKKVLLYFNKNNTQFYAVHPFAYSLVASVVSFAAVGWIGCIICTVINTALCCIVIHFWNKLKSKRKALKAEKAS